MADKESPGEGFSVIRRFRRARLEVFCILFGVYVGYYFCRVTLPVAMPSLESSFSLSKTETGFILSVYYLIYSFAKLINGFLGDRLGGKTMLLVGVFGSVICNLAFSFGEGMNHFAAVWGLNAYFQSIGWLAMISILSQWYPSRESGRSLGVMSLSYLLGDFLARASAGLVLMQLSWRGMFWVHAGVLGAIGAAAYLLLRPSPGGLGLPDLETYDRHSGSRVGVACDETGARAGSTGSRSEYLQHLAGMLGNRAFWIVCLVCLSLSIVRYVFWGWSVQYLIDRGSGIGLASMASAVFPLFGCAGTILAGWISDRMDARRGPVMAVMCTLLAGSIFAFSRIPGQDPVLLTMALGLIGFSLYGPYSMLAGAIALDFGSRHSSASAAGIIDAVGAFGTIITGVGMGYLIDRYGWNTAFFFVLSVTLVAAGSSFALWNTRAYQANPPQQTAA
ncbi:MAG: MFS transporter [Acidobacteria bacterium]|nr:MFS transporter [Acidobacteriota bacterium]MCW5969081.1 MFS transporter [Blastocatellales bacterium]